MALPKTTTDRIENEAEAYANKYLNGKVNTHEFCLLEEAYIAGATAEAERAQKLVEALELAKSKMNWIENADAIDIIRNALQQWNAGKEIDRPCPHCGKELNRDRNLCCECGKEVEPVKEIEYMPIHPDDAEKFDCPTQFPMHLLNEEQAEKNHGQSLKRLKERGGLSVKEILAIVGKKNWSYYRDLQWKEAIGMLNDIITNPTK